MIIQLLLCVLCLCAVLPVEQFQNMQQLINAEDHLWACYSEQVTH